MHYKVGGSNSTEGFGGIVPQGKNYDFRDSVMQSGAGENGNVTPPPSPPPCIALHPCPYVAGNAVK